MLMRPQPLSVKTPLPLWQSAMFADVLRGLGTDAQIETLDMAGQVMVIRRGLGPFGTLKFASRGPIWGTAVADDVKVDALRAAKLHIVNAEDPNAQIMRRAGFRRLRKPMAVSVLNIQDGLEAQLAQCRGKWRNAYRQAERLRLKTRHAPYDAAKDRWIFSADQAQQKAKGYRALPAALVRAIAANGRENVVVSQVMEGDTPIAAMLFLVHGTAATYHIGITTRAGRGVNAHHLLLMQAAQKLGERGVIEMELGLHQPLAAPGLARFKQGSGARVKHLGGTWIKIPFL